MRLTSTHRMAFVSAVMQDIPTVDYETQIRDFALQYFVDKLPHSVRQVYDDVGTRGYVAKFNYWTGIGYVLVPAPRLGLSMSDEAKSKLGELRARHDAQRAMLEKMRAELGAVIAGHTTRASAAAALPELEKYLPQPAPKKTANLPAIVTVVGDLTKLGWPKEKVAA